MSPPTHEQRDARSASPPKDNRQSSATAAARSWKRRRPGPCSSPRLDRLSRRRGATASVYSTSGSCGASREAALRREQHALLVEPAGIAAQRPVAADHAVARDQHRDMIVAVGACRPPGPPPAGRSPRRSGHSCGSRPAGSCGARATPLPGRPFRRRRSAGRASPPDARSPRARPRPARGARRRPRRSSPWGTAGEAKPRCRRTSAGRCPWTSRRSASGPAGCRNGVQRMVSPRPPSRHADGVIPSRSLASL